MADPLPRTSGPSSALRNEGLTNRDIQEAERRKSLQNLKFQELLRTVEARTSQIQSPSNFVQQGIFNAFGNNVATQSLIQGAGLASDLIFGPAQNPEEKMHDETKELLKKANETLSLMDESISTIQKITKIILDNILDSNKSLRRIVDISEQSMESAKKMLSNEQDDDKPKLLECEEGVERCSGFPDNSVGEVLKKETPLRAALEYTPFTIESKEVSPDKFDATQEEQKTQKVFEKVGQDIVEVLDKVDIKKAAMGYTPFTIEGQINPEKRSLSYEEPKAKDCCKDGVFDFDRQGNTSNFEKTSDISEQEKALEEERYRQQMLNMQKNNGGSQQAITALNEQQAQQSGIGMLEMILGAGAISSIKSLFSKAKEMLGGLFNSIKKVAPAILRIGGGLLRLVSLINPISLKIAAIAAVVGGAAYFINKFIDSDSRESIDTPGFSGVDGFDVAEYGVPDDGTIPPKVEKTETDSRGFFEKLFGSEPDKPEITPMTPVNVLPKIVPANNFSGQSNKEVLQDFLNTAKPVSNTNSVVAMKEAAIKNEVEKFSPKVSSVMPSQTNVVNSTNVNNQTILPNRSLPKNNESSFNRYMENSFK